MAEVEQQEIPQEEPAKPVPEAKKTKPPVPKASSAEPAEPVVDPHFFGDLSRTLKEMHRAERTHRLSSLPIV